MTYNGCSYEKRVKDVNEIYERYSRTGLSNREIWRRYVHPVHGISEKTFYNYLNASAEDRIEKRLKKVGIVI